LNPPDGPARKAPHNSEEVFTCSTWCNTTIEGIDNWNNAWRDDNVKEER